MIILNSINKTYKRKSKTINVLKDINLTLDDTGLVILKGKSGAGKTTLLNIIYGIEKQSGGEVLFNDRSNDMLNSSFSYMFQDSNLFANLTVLDNINIYKEVDELYLEGLMKKLDITHLKNKKVKNLSGGEKRRISLLRALIKEPSILLCDEPTASLDKENSKIVYNILHEYSKDHLVIVSNHDEDLFAKYDMLIELEDGSISKVKGCTYKKDDLIDNKMTKELDDKFIRKVSKHVLFNNKLSLVLSLVLLIICITILNLFINVNNVDYSSIQRNIMEKENNDMLLFKDEEIKDDNIIEGKIFMKDDAPLKITFRDHEVEKLYYGGIDSFLAFYPYDSDFVGNNYLGKIPQGSNEIMIYQILGEHIMNYGIIDANDEVYKPQNIEELIGKPIKISGADYLVSGIIKQDLNEYSILKNFSINSDELPLKDLLLDMYYSEDVLSYNNVIIVSNNSYEEMLKTYKTNESLSSLSFKIVKNYNEAERILTKLYNKPNLFDALNNPQTYYISGTSYSNVLEKILYMPYCFSLIIKYIIPIIVLIMIILIFIFFYNIFIKNKIELSLLQSLGFSNKNINKTMIYSMFIYLVISLSIGLLLSFIILYGINIYLNSLVPFYLMPFEYRIDAFLWIIVVIIATGIISYIFLGRAIRKLKISQNIRNN